MPICIRVAFVTIILLALNRPASAAIISQDGTSPTTFAHRVGIGTITPAAALDVALTGTSWSAIVVPRDTVGNSPAVPINGMIRYNTSSGVLEAYTSNGWGQLLAGIPSNVVLNGGNSVAAPMTVGTTNGYALNLMTNNSATFTLDTNGNITNNTTATGPMLSLVNPANRSVMFMETDTSSTTSNAIFMKKARGLSNTTPAAINLNDILGTIGFRGYGGAASSWTDLTSYDFGFEVRAAENFTTSAHGTRMYIYSTPTGSTTKVFRMAIMDNGMIGFNNAAPGSVVTVNNDNTTKAPNALQAASAVPNQSQSGFYMSVLPQHSASGSVSYNDYGANIQNASATPSGMTQTGTEIGLSTSDLRNSAPGASDSGTVNSLIGTAVLYGHANQVSGQTPQTVQAIGVNIQPFSDSGTISNLWGLRLSPPTNNGGSVTSAYAVYSDWTAPWYISGRVGFGTASPGYSVDVVGDVNLSSSGALRFNGTAVCTSSGCTSSSDETLKSNVRPLDGALEKITRLRGVEFDWKDTARFSDRHQIGVIAQEIERVFPEVVTVDAKTGERSVAYDHLVAPLIEAVRTLEARDGDLRRENAELRARLDRLERRLGDH